MILRTSLAALALAMAEGSAQAATVPFSSHCAPVPGGQACYAINVPAAGSEFANDLYFTMTGPSSLGYSGMGFGSQMRNSLFFIAQPSAGNVTMSLRTAPGEIMPTAYTASAITLEPLAGTTNNGTVFTSNFRCVGCRSWSTGSVDVTSTSAPMIWAVGALSNGASATSTTAGIQYHGGNNGNFALNLVSATGEAGIPGAVGTGTSGSGPSSTTAMTTSATTGPAVVDISSGASSSGASSSATSNRSRGNLWWTHAAFACVGWILILGVGAVVVRFFPASFARPVRVHYILQAIGVLFVTIGVILGIVGSSGGHFEYAHQTVGIVVFALMFLQAALGSMHHALFASGKRGGFMVMGWIHRYLGRALIVAAMVTAGLAFRMPMVALSKGAQIAWYVVMGALVLVYTIANIVMQVKTGKSTGLKQQTSNDTLSSAEKRMTGQHGSSPSP